MLGRWLSAFALTQVIEVPIYTRALARREKSASLVRRCALAFGASALTHPIVWFALPVLWGTVRGELPPDLHPALRSLLYYTLLESVAVGGEMLYLRVLGVMRPWRWSLLANAASFGTGLVCQWLFAWP